MTDKKIVTQLIKFGFTVPQAKLYFAGLKSGPELMARLAKQSGVRRTTAYYMMEELERRGFFVKRKVGKRTYYAAASLHRLLRMAKHRERLVRKLMRRLAYA
jgi:sugar-specific transcriptional regulator TrmB